MEIDEQKQKEILKVSYPIPFYSQRVDFNEDDLQGFKSKQEAEHWQVRGCGIASLKMIIDGFQKQRGLKLSDPYGELIYKGVEKGAYCDRGWIHKGLVELAMEYKIHGQTFRQCSVSDVFNELEKNRPCITSVTVGFNGGKINSEGEVIPAGGHLIVVIGAVRENGVLQGFIVNHPSSSIELNWENHFVDIEDFKRSFSGAFMSFWIS
ncbi:C39 family peptidase [Paenibacillus sp. GCM10027626]|uniref:C39 family peptidase n=1 Tax=Paenibacillus sp. GCM10027626 TaxID=3273411 RepID=UPI00362CBAEF